MLKCLIFFLFSCYFSLVLYFSFVSQSCQITNDAQYPAGTKETTFSVDSEGNVVITYGKSTSGSSERYDTQKCYPNRLISSDG